MAFTPSRRGLAASAASRLAPKVTTLAPGVTSTFVREALHRAIVGAGPLPPAAAAAEEQLREQGGDVARAIHEVIENHVRYAGAQGFLTNIGGIVSAAVTVPANLAGVALVQSRMVAGIAHLRGYDLDDPRTRNAILAILMGEDTVAGLVRDKVLPATPYGLANAAVADPTLDRIITGEVASDLIQRVAGKRIAITVGRRVPVVGGVVGASADGYSTWKLGRYADRELLPRAER